VDTDPASDPIQPAPGAGDGPAGPAPAGEGRSARVEAVRRAVDQALTATAGAPRTTRARAQELADELGSVVTRVRGTLEELGAAGTSQAGLLADELGGVVGRLGRTLDEARPATADEVRRLADRLDALEARLDRMDPTGVPSAPSPAP
jgi:hypothetical protein